MNMKILYPTSVEVVDEFPEIQQSIGFLNPIVLSIV